MPDRWHWIATIFEKSAMAKLAEATPAAHAQTRAQDSGSVPKVVANSGKIGCTLSAPPVWPSGQAAASPIELVASRCQEIWRRFSHPVPPVVVATMNSIPIVIDSELLNGLLHDLWFSLGSLRYDSGTQEATMRLGARRHEPFDAMMVTITEVQDVSISDEAQIDVYDIASVSIADDRIVLTSGFPLRIIFRVRQTSKIIARSCVAP